MRAVKFVDKKVVVEDVPMPSDDGVLVKVRACGICGSDIHMLELGFPIHGIPGHEISGELEDGTPVAIEPYAPCGSCGVCLEGDTQLCAAGSKTICGVWRDGGMAEYIRVPERSLVTLPRGVDASSAFLVEPLGVSLHGVRRSRLDGRSRVLVIGGGAIGLSAVVAAVAARASTDLVARHPAQIAAGRQLGAQLVTDPAGGDYDVVLECAGSNDAIELACNALRPGGQMILLSSPWGTFEMPGFILAAKELDIRVSSMYGRSGTVRDVDAAAAILGSNDAIADALITDRYPLDEAPAAFARSLDRAGGAIKVALEP